MRTLGFLAVLALLHSPALPAQTIEGRLLEAGSDQPIILGEVFLLTGGGVLAAHTLTDEGGYFALTASEAGSYFLRAERFGYGSRVDGLFDLGEGGILSVEFRLPRNPIALDSLQISVESRSTKLSLLGFYDRQRTGFGGVFIGPEEIEKKVVFESAELLRNIPRVRIRFRPYGGSEVTIRGSGSTSLSGGGLCYPNVVIDGNVVFRGEPARLDEVVRPHEIFAIEVYRGPSEIPLQFGGARSPCGVILIWTR